MRTGNKYQARIFSQGSDSFYALIVRVDSDGSEQVINTYKGRYFASLKNAERSTNKALKELNGE